MSSDEPRGESSGDSSSSVSNSEPDSDEDAASTRGKPGGEPPKTDRVVPLCDECGEPKYATNSEGCTCGKPDLPVAGTFTLDPQYEQGIIWNNDPVDSPELEEGDEFVKKSDAEEAVQEAWKQAIEEGMLQGMADEEEAFHHGRKEGRKRERQRILDKAEELLEDKEFKNKLDWDDIQWQGAKKLVEELRDDLLEEQTGEFGVTQITKGKPENKTVEPDDESNGK